MKLEPAAGFKRFCKAVKALLRPSGKAWRRIRVRLKANAMGNPLHARCRKAMSIPGLLIIYRLLHLRQSLFFSLVLSGAISSSLQHGDSHSWIALHLSDGRCWNVHVRCLFKDRLTQQITLGHLGIALLAQLAQENQIKISQLDPVLFEQLEIDLWQRQNASDFEQVLELIDLIETQASPLVILKPENGKLIPVRYLDALRSQRVLLHKGSFNPVTCAHLEMIQRVLQQDANYLPVLEISVMNADKGLAEKHNLAHRLMMLAHQPSLIALTRTPPLYLSRELFQDHAGAAQVDFICGEDLYQRVFQARYYNDLAGGIDEGLHRLFQSGSCLWVCQRQNDIDFPKEAQAQAKRYQSYLNLLEMELPMASSSIRADIQAGRTDWHKQVIEAVAEYIQAQGLYQ